MVFSRLLGSRETAQREHKHKKGLRSRELYLEVWDRIILLAANRQGIMTLLELSVRSRSFDTDVLILILFDTHR